MAGSNPRTDAIAAKIRRARLAFASREGVSGCLPEGADPVRDTRPDYRSAVGSRGYFLAVDQSGAALLLRGEGDDERVIEAVRELDDSPDCSVDKAWDGIHRCLTLGELGGEDGTYPLDQEGLGYLLDYLREVTAFYQEAAQAGRATVFVVDQ
jgi:hypothetical protein